jgi:hypothetical protein
MFRRILNHAANPQAVIQTRESADWPRLPAFPPRRYAAGGTNTSRRFAARSELRVSPGLS